jgi:hypothetical protein
MTVVLPLVVNALPEATVVSPFKATVPVPVLNVFEPEIVVLPLRLIPVEPDWIVVALDELVEPIVTVCIPAEESAMWIVEFTLVDPVIPKFKLFAVLSRFIKLLPLEFCTWKAVALVAEDLKVGV